MIFFTVTHDFTLSAGALQLSFRSQDPALRVVQSDRIYCFTAGDFLRMAAHVQTVSGDQRLNVLPERQIRSLANFPVELGMSNIDELPRLQQASGRQAGVEPANLNPVAVDLAEQISAIGKSTLRIAIVNGFGTGIGDSIVGLTAFRITRDEMLRSLAGVSCDVLVSPNHITGLAPLFDDSEIVQTTRALPITLHEFIQYDAYFDTGGCALREDFNRLPGVDYYLRTFGIDPGKVGAIRKQNSVRTRIPASADAIDRALDTARTSGRPILLFHPTASTKLRSIPLSETMRIVAALVSDNRYQVVTVVPLPTCHRDIIDLSTFSSGYRELSYLVSNMDAVLTVDTSIYHIAAGFDVPSVVWFSCIDPGLRVPYYSLVHGILLEGARSHSCFMQHALDSGPALQSASRLWEGADVEEAIAALDKLKEKRGLETQQQ